MCIQSSCNFSDTNEKSYNFGDLIWFKLESSHKWRAGKVLGQDGKVLFVKYGNFIRRVPLDFVVSASEYTTGDDEEIDFDEAMPHTNEQAVKLFALQKGEQYFH